MNFFIQNKNYIYSENFANFSISILLKKVKAVYNDPMESFNYNIFFNEAISQIKEELTILGKQNELCFFMIKYVDSKELKVIASVPSTFIRDRMITNGYTSQIESKLKEISGYNIKIELTIDNNMNTYSTPVNNVEVKIHVKYKTITKYKAEIKV